MRCATALFVAVALGAACAPASAAVTAGDENARSDRQQARELMARAGASSQSPKAPGTCPAAVSADPDASTGLAPKLLRSRVCIVPYELVRGDSELLRCAACLAYDRRLNEVPLSERYPSSHYAWDSVIDNGSVFKPGKAVQGAGESAMQAGANAVFGVNRWVIGANASLTQEAFTMDVTNNATESSARAFTKLHNGLFHKFAAALIVYAGLWFLWRASLGQMTRGFVGVGLAFCCMIGAFYLVARPAQTIDAANDTSTALATSVLGVIGKADESATGRGRYFEDDPAKRQIAKINDRIWKVFVYDPWVMGEFGFKEAGNKDAQGRAITKVDRQMRRDTKRVLTTPPGMRLEEPSDIEKRLGALDLKKMKRPDVDEGDAIYPGLEGKKNVSRFIGAAVNLLCAVAFTLVQGVMAVTILLSQFVFLFLVVIGPFVLLAGLIPEVGFVIVKNWLGAIFGTLILKTIYALALGVMATMFSLLQGMSSNVAGQGGMLVLSTVLFVVIFHQRKRLFNLTGRTSEAIAGAMGVAGQTGKAMGQAKDSTRDAARTTTRATGRVSRGAAAPVLAVGGGAMQRAGSGLNERAVDGRGGAFAQRTGRLLGGDPADEESRGLGGRLKERATRYRMQATKGKMAGARAAARHEGGRFALLMASLRRPGRSVTAAQDKRAVERRRKADDEVRVGGFQSSREVKQARSAVDMHDFRKGEIDMNTVLRRDEARVNRRQSATRRAKERETRVSREERAASRSSSTPAATSRRAAEENDALSGAAHRRQTTQKADQKKPMRVKSERQRWAVIRNTRRRKGKGK